MRRAITGGAIQALIALVAVAAAAGMFLGVVAALHSEEAAIAIGLLAGFLLRLRATKEPYRSRRASRSAARELPEGPLRDALLELAQEAGVPVASIHLQETRGRWDPQATVRLDREGAAHFTLTSFLVHGFTDSQVRAVFAHGLGDAVHGCHLGSVAYWRTRFLIAVPLTVLLWLLLPWWLCLLCLAAALPVAWLVFLSRQRARKLRSDRYAAQLTGDPEALAEALIELHRFLPGQQAHTWRERLRSAYPDLRTRLDRLWRDAWRPRMH